MDYNKLIIYYKDIINTFKYHIELIISNNEIINIISFYVLHILFSRNLGIWYDIY